MEIPLVVIVVWIGLVSGFILIVVGALWSPFAGLICANIARNKGADILRYRKEGTQASLHQFLPWLYVVSLMRERPVSEQVVRLGYIIIYALWFLGPIGMWVAVALLTMFTSVEDLDAGSAGVKALWVVVYVAIAVFNGSVWYRSLQALHRFHHSQRTAVSSLNPTIHEGYLKVFKYSVASYAAVPLFVVIAVILAFATGEWE